MTLMPAPDGTAVGFEAEVVSEPWLPGLAAGDESRRASETQLGAGAIPGDGLRAAGGDDGERRDAAVNASAAVADALSCRCRRRLWVRRRARRCESQSRDC